MFAERLGIWRDCFVGIGSVIINCYRDVSHKIRDFAATYFSSNRTTFLLNALITLLISLGLIGGSITVTIAVLLKHGLSFTQIVVIQQLSAALLCFVFFKPRNISLYEYPALAKRSLFMSLGWLFSIRAIQSGNPLVVQSIMATVPLLIVLMEIIIYKRHPSLMIILSRLITMVGISILAFVA